MRFLLPDRFMPTLVRWVLRFYGLFISPLIHALAGPGSGCRFEPSCSKYSQDALDRHGLFRGLLLTLWRIARCQPLARAGYDPVPGISKGSQAKKDPR